VEAVSLSTQRATVLAVDRDGAAIGRAVSWQDGRGVEQAAALRGAIDPARYAAITGLPINPVFTVAKLMWIREHDRARAKAARYVLVHDWVMRRLGAPGFVTDLSNASLTGLLDIRTRAWSPEVLDLAGLDASRLPVLVAPGTRIGSISREAAAETGLKAGTPLIAGGGDQQCAGLGAGAVGPGRVEVTHGTAGVPLCWSDRPAGGEAGGLMCCVHAAPGAWEVEGFQNSAGSALAWAESLLGLEGLPQSELDARIATVQPGAGGLLFFPYLYGGSSAPHWNEKARGMLVGLTHRHDATAILRSVVEGVCLETREVTDVFAAAGLRVDEIRLTGGCSRVPAWCQVLADVCRTPVWTLENADASLVGAAVLAALGVGAFATAAEAAEAMVRPRTRHEPRPDAADAYGLVYDTYRRAYRAVEAGGVFERLRS
jgi:xylulokinase